MGSEQGTLAQKEEKEGRNSAHVCAGQSSVDSEKTDMSRVHSHRTRQDRKHARRSGAASEPMSEARRASGCAPGLQRCCGLKAFLKYHGCLLQPLSDSTWGVEGCSAKSHCLLISSHF